MNLLRIIILFHVLCIASVSALKSYSQYNSDSVISFYKNLIQHHSFEETEHYFNNLPGDLIQTQPKLAIELATLYITNAIGKQKLGAIPGALARIGQAYFTLGDIEKSIDYSEKSIDMLDYFGRADETGFMLIDLGNVELLDRKIDAAKSLYQRAIKVFQRKKDFKGLAVAWNNMGIALNREQKYDSALVYYNKALKIREKYNEPYFILQSYIYLAQTYNFLKNTEKALEAFHVADSIALTANPEKDAGYSVVINLYDAKGNFYYQRKEFKNAIRYFVLAAEFARENFGDKIAEADEYSMAAKAAMLDNDYQKAIKLAMIAKNLGEESNSNINQILAYEVLYKSYAELGNYKDAYHAHHNYTNLYRLVESNSITEKLNSLESKFQIREKEQLLMLKDAELVAMKEEEKNQILINWIIAGFCAVAVIILTLVMRLFWISHKSNKELVSKNLIIEHKSNELLLANKTKDIMISVIAHDLRNPINAIISFADLIENDAQKFAEGSVKKYAKIIQNSGKQTSILLENLLQWYQTQSGKMSYNPKQFYLKESLQVCLDDVKGMAEAKNIEFRFHVAGIKLFSDEQMLQTILRNFITNAIKFVPTNGIIKISTRADDNHFELLIEDNGPGFDNTHANSMNGHQYDSMKGSGLGMILCRDFLDRIGGAMETGKSELGGALIRILLPPHLIVEVSKNSTEIGNISFEKNVLSLSVADILLLQNSLGKYQMPKIYEATKWKIIIDDLRQFAKNNEIQDWIEQLEKAVFMSNQNDLDHLLNQITVKI